MSTKTSIKRVALVAVSALGFGLLSVVPAKAAVDMDADVTLTHQGSTNFLATNGLTPVAAGTQITINIRTVMDEVDAAATLALAFTLENPNGADITSSATFAAVAAPATGITGAVTGSTITLTAADESVLAAATTIGTVTFTPRMGGIYTLANTEEVTGVDITNTGANLDGTDTNGAIYVSGTGVVVATSGVGTQSATAVTGGIAQARFATTAKSVASQVFNITSSGVGVIQATAAGSGTANVSIGGIAGATDFSQGVRQVTSNETTNQNQVLVTVASTVAGTQTLTYTAINPTTGAPTTIGTVSITWASASSTLASSVTSKVYINAGGATVATLANDDTADGIACTRSTTASVTKCANLYVEINDSNGAALVNAPLSVTITGPGTIGVDTASATIDDAAVAAITSTGRSLSATAVSGGATDNLAAIVVFSDGTAGTATITVKSGTITLATKSVIFYGTVAKLTATQNLKVARASAAGAELGCGAADCEWLGTAASTPAVYIEATDADGNIVPGLVIAMVSDNTNVISSATITQDDATAGDGPGYYNASVTSAPGGVSGTSTKVRFRTLLASGAYVTSDDLEFSLGGTVATATLTLDKAAYQPGEAMVVTRTAKDSAGNPVYDGVASPAVVFSKAIGGTAPAAGEYRSGVSASSSSRPTVFAPSTGGAFEARATFSFAGVSTQVTAAASVADDASTVAAQAASDAAAEAIDAANAATDAANLAAEAADAATVAAEEARDAADAATAAVEELASQVATLMAALKAQITTLANTVAKIAKKVKA